MHVTRQVTLSPLEPTPIAVNPLHTVALDWEPIRTTRMETLVGHVQNPAAINGVRMVNYAAGCIVVLPTPGRVVLPTPGRWSSAVLLRVRRQGNHQAYQDRQ